MSISLPELIELVDRLEAQVPTWLKTHPDPADFWPLFAGEADVIEDSAGAHAGEISRRIHAIAAKAAQQLEE